jgi:hypothetical protein
MRIRNQLPIILLFLLLVYACGPSQEEKASVKVNEAKSLIAKGDTLKAITLLKAVSSQNPKAKFQIAASKNLTSDLYLQLINNRKTQLTNTENIISSLEKHFIKDKTEFDSYVQYIPLSLSHGKSWNKSFLQVNLDERGELFLTSHYMGQNWLKHTSIKVYDEGLSVKTPDVPLDDPNNRESDFLDYKWEKVAYTNGKSDSVIKFITTNVNRNLKCVYIGKNHYYIILEEYNKEAIKDAYQLSKAIMNKKNLLSQIKELETTISGLR